MLTHSSDIYIPEQDLKKKSVSSSKASVNVINLQKTYYFTPKIVG